MLRMQRLAGNSAVVSLVESHPNQSGRPTACATPAAGDYVKSDALESTARAGPGRSEGVVQRAASRSVAALLENKTQATLRQVSNTLAHGVWAAKPPAEVAPGTTARWSSESSGFMTGTEGSVDFAIEGAATPCRFSWNNPFIGSNSVSASAPPGYKIIHSGLSGNNGTVAFQLIRDQQAPKPVVQGPWRELARKRVPFDQWPLEQKQLAHRERDAAVRRQGANQSTHEWLQTRDADNELFALLWPYHDEQRAFFERSTQIRVESSANPVKSGQAVTITIYVSLPTQKIPTGEVEFTFINLELRRIHGQLAPKPTKKVTLTDGKASVTIPMIGHTTDIEVRYPDTGELIGSNTSMRQLVDP
ncbi:MAG: hypothetical protein GEV03_23390 [Streptosporangiales bacterium]|nr:hypothetical protein [Streptosporangiales bacterium]